MKKSIPALIFCFIFISVGFAQEDNLLKDKKERIVLPEKGDFSIGIGANPFFRYFGNMLSSGDNNQLNLSLFNNQLYGKYFVSSQSAIRIRLGFYQDSKQADYRVKNDTYYAAFVTDKLEQTYNNLDLTLGYEWRKGFGRLQISYGAEFNLKFTNSSEKYSYGNEFSSSNPSPTTYLFGASFYRPLEIKDNSGTGVGARFFTGIEYFLLPKISIGGELGIGYIMRFNGESIQKREYWDWDSNMVSADDSSGKFDSSTTYTDILNGQIFLLFHF